MDKIGYIYGINGPVVKMRDHRDFFMQEMVYVGKEQLSGEVIAVFDDHAVVQVYENTTGVAPGESIIGSGIPLSAMLGPGMLSEIFDGIQRPLGALFDSSGAFIERGINISALPAEKEWDVEILVKKGDKVEGGQFIAQTPETANIMHKIMVPPQLSGRIKSVVKSGLYKIDTTLAVLEDAKGREHELKMYQKWPIRVGRPFAHRIPLTRPLITGQRVVDSMFPVAKGGAATVPGGFGTGKTMTQHQLAKWSDADIIVYIGCGERGNEMSQVLQEFSELIDPHTKKLLMDRTILIANTSNMPVAAREASIYTGITMAEYYRDMGYHVAIMADSTSRWAEALREISGRLEEMPAEEGFPAYLPSRLAAFYERAGYVTCDSGAEGSVTIIGAVSPQGGDFSEPVTQNTKRFTRTFWALDRSLAYMRHYPAIHWLNSYSEYFDDLSQWYIDNVGKDFPELRKEFLAILTEESALLEIVKLIGSDVLPDDQKLTLEIARIIRTGFLQQNAYHDNDTYVPLEKQYKMMRLYLKFYDKCKQMLEKGVSFDELSENALFSKLVTIKYDIPNDQQEKFDELFALVDELA